MPITVPQLMKDAPMTIVSYKADRDALRQILPPGLDPHPEGRVVLNMWDQNVPGSSSGFGSPGSVSVTYLAIEVEGHDSWTADGTISAPGRYFAGQWISDADGGGFRAYARQEAGVGAHTGETIYARDGEVLTAKLNIEDRECITLSASIGEDKLGTVGGHLNYFCDRNAMGEAGKREIAHIAVPFVFELFPAEVEEIVFKPNDVFRLLGGRSAMDLAPLMPLAMDSVMYGLASWAPFRVVETWPSRS